MSFSCTAAMLGLCQGSRLTGQGCSMLVELPSAQSFGQFPNLGGTAAAYTSQRMRVAGSHYGTMKGYEEIYEKMEEI